MTKGGKAEKWAARSSRLSAALRENLKRRKDQVREREKSRRQAAAEETPAGTPAETPQGMGKQTVANSPLPEAQMPASPEFRRNQVRE
jgi:hypothetical protein